MIEQRCTAPAHAARACNSPDLIEEIANAVVVIVVHVVANEPSEMLFVQSYHMVENRRKLLTQRSAVPFCQGACRPVSFGSKPVAFRKANTSTSNFES